MAESGFNMMNLSNGELDDIYNEFTSAVADWNSQLPSYSRVSFGILFSHDTSSSINISKVQVFQLASFNTFALAAQPTTDGNRDPFGIRFNLDRYQSVFHNLRMNRSDDGSYYKILQHEMGHVAGFRHTNEDDGDTEYVFLSQLDPPSVMNSPAHLIVPANTADGIAMRLLYPNHSNSYDLSLVSQAGVANNNIRLTIAWTNREQNKPLHTKAMYTVQKTSGKGIAFFYISAFRDNSGILTVDVPKNNVYIICVAGSNYREDQVFPGRCIGVSTGADSPDEPESGGFRQGGPPPPLG